MSLNRVASIETFQGVPAQGRGRRGSDASTRARKISFNPLPETWDPITAKGDAVNAVGAFEVPQWKRIAQVTTSALVCLLAAGVVFGYAALKPVLKQEGAYQDVCGKDGDLLTEDPVMCVEIHLNFMFTVAAVATNIAALPVGAILDHFGPRVAGLMGSGFLILGSLLMAYAKRLPFDAYLLGYLCLALGGPFTYISTFQLSNAFPRHSSFIISLLTGAFDASSALFLVYRVIYENTGGGFGSHQFFLAYLVVPTIIILLQFTLLPKQSYKTMGELVEDARHPPAEVPSDQIDESTALLQEEERERHETYVRDVEDLLGSPKATKQARREEKQNERSGIYGVMHDATALQQIMSPWFILICLFTVIQMTRINYFVATIRAQYEAIFGSHEQAVEINRFFDLALPVGGVIAVPFVGTLLNYFATVTVLTSLVTVATAIGLLGVLPHAWAAYMGVILFVLYRPFYYTAVSDYTAKVFGFRTFGTVYGTIICLSGLFNFSQPGLDFLFHQTFGGDPVPVNIILLGLGLVVGVALVLYVGVKAGGAKRELLEREADQNVFEDDE